MVFLGNQYLIHVYKFSDTKASIISSMLFLGTIVGSPTMGWISDRMGLRRLPMLLVAIIAVIIILSVMHLRNPSANLLLLLFLILGFVTSTQVISYPIVAESNSKLLTATSVSVVSLSVISGGAIFNPIFGGLIDFHAKNTSHAHMIYAVADFQFAIWLLPIAFIGALIAAWFVHETYCHQ